ncbi:hypothetical protein L484_005447 [Morus notabilis]|uniref:Uncharacterized protein n=1 Tax=Morus notabilis TaxID=981085 RepID=W9S5A7_9ROSA|nr:hypothetical protein L484_005447 [Morus notabilis]
MCSYFKVKVKKLYGSDAFMKKNLLLVSGLSMPMMAKKTLETLVIPTPKKKCTCRRSMLSVQHRDFELWNMAEE